MTVRNLIVYMVFCSSALLGMEHPDNKFHIHQMRTKQIHFSSHAKKRMDERGVSRGEVEKAIGYGIRFVDKTDHGITFIRDNLVVVMDPKGETVITLYLTQKTADEFLPAKQRALREKKERELKRAKERTKKLQSKYLLLPHS